MLPVKNILLLFHTLRHLKPIQIHGRFWFRLYRPSIQSVSNARARKAARPLSRFVSARQSLFVLNAPSQSHALPGAPNAPENASRDQTTDDLLSESVFRFLGDELTIRSADDWNCASKAKLFLYNVHYFDDLNAVGADDRTALHAALIERWIEDNPDPVGNGWEPYPLSLRIINWIRFFNRLESVPAHWLNSLATQARYLSRRLEYHLLGNHLFTNAKALIVAGCYLEQQDDILATGLSILERELPEQILADGGHFELSPMYHSIALADLLDLINLGLSYPEKFPESMRLSLEKTVLDMFEWLQRMLHPDGQISLFNDAAMDIAPGYLHLVEYAESLDLRPVSATAGVHHAKNTGYVTVHAEDLCCILDIGHVGPDYIPGHAHADSLTFEMSLFGQRLICNSGTSVYGDGKERLRQRGTASHNTVVVNQQDSSEVWSGFRVARRAHPLNISLDQPVNGHEGLVVEASHSGYWRLPGKNTHARQWSFANTTLTIVDTLSGSFDSATAYFHLHPDVHVAMTQDGISMVLGEGQIVRLSAVGGTIRIEPSTWHPCFGTSTPSHRLAIAFEGSELVTVFSWKKKHPNQ